jgi:predicted ATP-grasp superfamily ATP-dependent carboligase
VTTPTLVLGSGITALGTLRSLVSAGVPVTVAAEDPLVERHSRWYRGGAPTPTRLDPETLTAYLEAHVPPGTVLVPTTDAFTLALARLPEDTRERWPVVTADAHAVEVLIDKARFADVLTACDVPFPETRPVESAAQLTELDDGGAGGGWFLKPTDSQRFFRRFKVKAVWVATPREAARWAARAEEIDVGLLVQEYVPGGADRHCYVEGYFTGDVDTSAWFARRRLRIYPPDFGNSTVMRSIAMDEVAPARDAVARVLQHLDFRGIFSAEFKQDPRDGAFKLLEVNARPWWYVEFAVRSGIDVVSWGYRDALGLPLGEPPGYRAGRRCVYPYYDYQAVRESAGRLASLVNVASWIGATQPVFRWRDPGPALHEVGTMVRRRLQRFTRTRKEST